MTGLTMAAAFSLLFAPAPPPKSLEEVRSEAGPIQRFDKALAFAEARMNEARKLAGEGGSRSAMESAIGEVARAAELALESLRATGRKPARLSRQYKRGEIRTRRLERALEDLALAVGFDEREAVERAGKRVSAIHDEFLRGIMSGR